MSIENISEMRPISRKKIRKRRNKRIRLLLFFLISLSIMGFVLTRKLSLFNISTIKVVGNNRLTAEDIINKSTIKNGENIFSFDKTKALNEVNSMAYIRSVKIKRNLPSTLVINVVERKPYAQIVSDSETVIIDEEGIVLEKGNVSQPDLLTIKGFKTEDLKIGDNAFEASNEFNIKEFLAELGNSSIMSMTDSISIDKNRTLSLFLDNGITVVIEGNDDFNYRLRMLDKILKDIEIKGIKTKLILMNKGEDPTVVRDE